MTEYIYLIKCQPSGSSYYKIGIANDPHSRMASLQTGNPFPLVLFAAYGFENAQVVERSIHQRFNEYRKRGEWFDLTDDEIDIFHQVCRLLSGTPLDAGYGVSEAEIEAAEEEQETQDILVRGIDWRLDRRNGRGYAIFKRGGAKQYIGYIGLDDMENPSHPTVEEVEAVLMRHRSNVLAAAEEE